MSTIRSLPTLVLLAALFLPVACATGPTVVIPSTALPPFPATRFAVFSDPHLYTPSLGMTGDAFWEDINDGKKLLHLSEEILNQTINEIIADPTIEFVVIPGDLTKDGERENHLRMVFFLRELEAAGKKVFVIPGNHDISNPHAFRFSGKIPEPILTVTAEEFAEIYRDFGYGEALARDPHSLSYVAEPVPGLWFFGLDSCAYEKNVPGQSPSTGGRLKRETLDWSLDLLLRAHSEGKAVMGAMHHGLLEHFPSQKKYFSDFVIDDWERVSQRLSLAGLRFMLTGHFHAQDIVLKEFHKKSFLYDIETSSLVTWPCAWRTLEFTDQNRLLVRTRPTLSLPSNPDFAHDAYTTLKKGVERYLSRLLGRYGVSADDRRRMVPQLILALLAHTAGDEKPPAVLVDRAGLSLGANILLSLTDDLVQGVWHDPPPADNNIDIDCATGGWNVMEPEKQAGENQ